MLNDLIEEASQNIENLDLDSKNYYELDGEVIVSAHKTNKVYVKDLECIKYIKKIIFSPNAQNAKIYLGRAFKGSTSINIQQSNSIVYIGNTCNLREVDIRTQALGSCIFIGNGITTTGNNSWLTGSFPGSKFSSIIIGDDCLFSNDITIRGSDGHPIMTFDFKEQINAPRKNIVIEPYVWIGQGVKILKSIRVGSASIIGTSTVITKDIPKFSKAYGFPVTFKDIGGIWIKDRREVSVETAKKYLLKHGKQANTSCLEETS